MKPIFLFIFLVMHDNDPRYRSVKAIIITKEISTFDEIFPTLPKTVLAKALGMSNKRMDELMNDIDKFKLGTIRRMSNMFKVTPRDIFDLLEAQAVKNETLLKYKKKNKQ